ncbi:MAG: ABC transporter ATP-binding protein [Alphaproteobacteria bacterium]|nr:ABC transporter ATP-binding protein [Alphaproteobacteria bacterium]
MLHINNLVYRVQGRLLFDNASAAIPAGHRVGLVGRNGTGKSTLLRLILGEAQADDGAIRMPQRASLGAVSQEAPDGAETPIEHVLAADAERAALLAERESSPDPVRAGEIELRLTEIDAHAAPAKAARILAGLGFDHEAQQRPLETFSGGWRMRVALGAQLFRQPDLLLLDEPTNHLDLEATIWLQGFLASYPGTLVLVSHDRELLNESAGHILHLDGLKLRLFTGNYDRFAEALSEERRRLSAEAEKIDARRKHMQSFVDRFRYKASKARQAQSRIKAIAKLATVYVSVDARAPSFAFPEPPAMAPPLLRLDRVSVGYGDKAVLRNLDLALDPDDRIALLGANGNGKSTLAKLLSNQLQAMAGEVYRAPRLTSGFFAQHQLDALDPARTPLEHIAERRPKETATQWRARLGRFGFGEDQVNTIATNLSGGEKARLVFCLISLDAPQLLILDEPTNHLDMDARTSLIEAIGDFPGAVVLVSHDPHLVRLVADRLWLVEDGTVRPFEGDVDDYRTRVLAQRQQERRAMRAAKGEPKAKPEKAAKPAVDRLDRDRRLALRKESRDAEAEIARLDKERARIESELADSGAYRAGGGRAAELGRHRADLARKIAAAEARWLKAQETLEAAG